LESNITGDPQLEYFADGMTKSLISALAMIGAFKATLICRRS
jgi:TolB-like protein